MSLRKSRSDDNSDFREFGSLVVAGSIIVVVAVGTLIILLMGDAAAATTAATESQVYYGSAKDSMQKGDRAAAKIELRNAVRSDPANSEARYDLAILYLAEGDPATALAELTTVQTRGYAAEKIALPQAQSYLALGRYQDVLTKVDTQVLGGDVRSAVLAVQARANIALGDYSAAHIKLSEAASISPNASGVILSSAMLMGAEGKIDEAEAQINKVSDDKNQLEFIILKGDLRQKKNDLEGANEYYNSAISKFPNYLGARIKRAILNVARQKRPAVEEDIKWILAKDPQNLLAQFLRAYLLAEDKKYRDATQALLALPRLLESYPPAIYLLAAAALEDGQVEMALDYAQRYLRSATGNVSGIRLLAVIHQRMDAPEKAVALLEPLVSEYPTDKSLKLQIAGALLAAGQSEKAIGLFQETVNGDSENVQARIALAVGQLRVGNADVGVAEIEKAIAAEPSSIQANTLLILTFLQGGRSEEALRVATAMVSANGKDPNAHNLLGTVYLANTDFERARGAFQAALQQDPAFHPAALNLARIEEREGDYDAALLGYQKITSLDVANVPAYEGLASVALRQKDTKSAVGYLKKAITQDKTAVSPRLILIETLLDHEDPKQALIEARDFVNAYPQSPQALDSLGRAQMASGDLAGGVSTYKRLAILNPTNAEVQRRLGRAYLKAESATAKPDATDLSNEAQAAFERGVSLSPDNLAILADRVELERRKNGDRAALTMAEAYASARPESVSRLIILGDTQIVMKELSAARQSYQSAWQKSPSSLTALRLYSAMAQGEPKGAALVHLQAWVKAHPADYDARFILAQDHIAAGRTAEAIAETEAIIAGVPENSVLLNNLAWLYGKDNPVKALAFAERAYAISPLSPDVLDTLGWLCIITKDTQRAETLLQQAFERAPTRRDIGFHYAVALESNNKIATAKRVLTGILAGDAVFAERLEAQAAFNKLD